MKFAGPTGTETPDSCAHASREKFTSRTRGSLIYIYIKIHLARQRTCRRGPEGEFVASEISFERVGRFLPSATKRETVDKRNLWSRRPL